MAKPTPRQLAYLAKLAERCGETFAVPTTRREASAEIERLKGRRPTSRSDRRRERREVGRDMAQQPWRGGPRRRDHRLRLERPLAMSGPSRQREVPQRGDEAALYERLAEPLERSVARALGGDRGQVEDACAFAWAQLCATQPERGERIFGSLRTTPIRAASRPGARCSSSTRPAWRRRARPPR